MLLRLRSSLLSLPKSDGEYDDISPRPRHRLSKPPTNRSRTNLSSGTARSTTSLLDDVGLFRRDSSPTSTLPRPCEELSALTEPGLSTLEESTVPAKSPLLEGGWNSETTAVHEISNPRESSYSLHDDQRLGSECLFGKSGFEQRHSRRAFFGNHKQQRRAQSVNFNNARAITRKAVPRKGSGSDSGLTTRESLAEMLEHCVIETENVSTGGNTIPHPRQASLTPGVATRVIKDGQRRLSVMNQVWDTKREYNCNSTPPQESPFSQLEALDVEAEQWWTTPPRIARTDTPSDLECASIGGLRLGTLRITNGRASPAPSEMSKCFKSRPTSNLRRDASSDYPGSEDEDSGTVYGVPQALPNSADRTCPPRSRSSLRSPGLDNDWCSSNEGQSPPKLVHEDLLKSSSFESVVSPDRTAVLAQEYMSELGRSPFLGPQLAARSESPEIQQEEAVRKGGILGPEVIPEEDSVALEPPLDWRSLAHIPDLSSVHKCCEAAKVDNELFNDSSSEDESMSQLDRRSRDSWYLGCVHENPVHSYLQSSMKSSSTSKQSTEIIKPPHRMDSGYCSKDSLDSTQGTIREPLEATADPVTDLAVNDSTRFNKTNIPKTSDRLAGGLTKPRPLPWSLLKLAGHEMPIFANLNQSTTTLYSVRSTVTRASDSPHKSQRLAKRRSLPQPVPVEFITVQGQQDILQDIPPVPLEIAANLALRVQRVPELEHTFSSMHHTREVSDCSNEDFYAPLPIRFPSPAGSKASSSDINVHHGDSGCDCDGSLVASEPMTRRKPWFSSKSNKLERSRSRRRLSSGISEMDARAIIQNFDTVASSLGGSPYDIACMNSKAEIQNESNSTESPSIAVRGFPRLPRGLPNHVKSADPRPKSIGMDDQTAAEVSRRKSMAVLQKDRMGLKAKRGSFNDRGGIPGKQIRPTSWATDIPPLPTQQQRSSYLRDTSNHRAKLCDASNAHYDAAPSRAGPMTDYIGRPSPPLHFPDLLSELASGTQTERAELTTTPTSPHPQSLSDGPPVRRKGSWSAQAQAWKSRRESVSAMLRHREPFVSGPYDEK